MTLPVVPDNQAVSKGGQTILRFFAKPLVIVLFAVSLASAFFFFRLDSYPMQNWDEGIHSQVSVEMLETNDYWSLHYQGQDYFRKPPVKIWLTAGLLSVFGEHNWVFRFWSALSGVGIAVLLSIFILRSEKNPVIAYLTVTIFVTGQFIMYHAFRTGEMDSVYLFFLVAGLFAYWQSEQKPKLLILAGALFGACIMTKSLAGAIGPIIIIADMLVRRRWHLFAKKELWLGVVAFCAVALPWHISQIMLHGKAFWDEYIGFHVIDRTFDQLYADLPVWWYAKILYQRLFPFSLFFIGALPLLAYDAFRKKDRHAMLVGIWMVVPLALFTLVKTKFEWYILPVYPAAAWIIGRYVFAVVRRFREPFFWISGVISLMLILALLPTAVVAGAKTWWFTFQAYIPHALTDLAYSTWWLTLLIVTAFFFVLYALRNKKAVVYVLLTLPVCYLCGFAFIRTAGMIGTQPTVSEYMHLRTLVAQYPENRIVLFKTDIYLKPAAYFELAKLDKEIVSIPRKFEEPNGFVTDNSLLITSEATLPSLSGKYAFVGQRGVYRVFIPITESLHAQ